MRCQISQVRMPQGRVWRAGTCTPAARACFVLCSACAPLSLKGVPGVEGAHGCLCCRGSSIRQ
jgi:hypothetical protein